MIFLEVNMFDKKIIDKVIAAVHKPLNFNDYNSTMTTNETNCYAHAIGSTVTSDRRVYRMGYDHDHRCLVPVGGRGL